MAHFAELDSDNLVLRVIVVSNDELVDGDSESEAKGIAFCQSLFGGRWVQTSYSGKFRKRFAGVGYRYEDQADAFVAPQPYPSWTLDADCEWQPPVPRPDGIVAWDEASQAWR